MCPELSPNFASNPNPTIEDIKPIIIEEGCGLRPARKGGIRLETGVIETKSGVKTPVVYNYGFVLFRQLHVYLLLTFISSSDTEAMVISRRGGLQVWLWDY